MSNTLTDPASLVVGRVTKDSPTAIARSFAKNATFRRRCRARSRRDPLDFGGFRTWRDQQFRGLYPRRSAASPFPLAEIPKTIGTWHVVEGSESHLDQDTARIAGSSDHFVRVYADSRETVSVLVLYGVASKVFGHTPIVCYPAAGYEPVRDSLKERREITVPGLATPFDFSRHITSGGSPGFGLQSGHLDVPEQRILAVRHGEPVEILPVSSWDVQDTASSSDCVDRS